MMVKVGERFLNLNNVVSVEFVTESDGVVAWVQEVSGHANTIRGPDVARLRELLEGLAANG